MMQRSAGAVLIGSGPSLNRVDVRRLAPFSTIAFNRSFLAWPDWGFAPTYHACLDPLTMTNIGPELAAVVAAHPRTRFFFHRDAIRFGVSAGERVTLSSVAPNAGFAQAIDMLRDLGNVGATSLQILALLGYRKVLMVGVDGRYLPERADVDVNHFNSAYARGQKPLTPADQVHYTASWPFVARECRHLGIQVRNASPGTALTCFEACGFAEGLDWLAPVHADARVSL